MGLLQLIIRLVIRNGRHFSLNIMNIVIDLLGSVSEPATTLFIHYFFTAGIYELQFIILACHWIINMLMALRLV